MLDWLPRELSQQELPKFLEYRYPSTCVYKVGIVDTATIRLYLLPLPDYTSVFLAFEETEAQGHRIVEFLKRIRDRPYAGTASIEIAYKQVMSYMPWSHNRAAAFAVHPNKNSPSTLNISLCEPLIVAMEQIATNLVG